MSVVFTSSRSISITRHIFHTHAHTFTNKNFVLSSSHQCLFCFVIVWWRRSSRRHRRRRRRQLHSLYCCHCRLWYRHSDAAAWVRRVHDARRVCVWECVHACDKWEVSFVPFSSLRLSLVVLLPAPTPSSLSRCFNAIAIHHSHFAYLFDCDYVMLTNNGHFITMQCVKCVCVCLLRLQRSTSLHRRFVCIVVVASVSPSYRWCRRHCTKCHGSTVTTATAIPTTQTTTTTTDDGIYIFARNK